MTPVGKLAVITGGASGIGFGLADRLRADGARAVVLADLPGEKLEAAGRSLSLPTIACDVTREGEVRSLVAEVERRFGGIDIFVSNAGLFRAGTEAAPDADWTLNWNVHVMAHVFAARALLPAMAERGGYLLISSSAAGLLSHINSATYAVTKHAAIAFAEYLSIQHGDLGLRVSVLCPQQVRTPLTAEMSETVSALDGAMSVEQLADCVMAGLAAERFLILPHPQVLDYVRRKTADYDRWLAGMRRLNRRFEPLDPPEPAPREGPH